MLYWGLFRPGFLNSNATDTNIVLPASLQGKTSVGEKEYGFGRVGVLS